MSACNVRITDKVMMIMHVILRTNVKGVSYVIVILRLNDEGPLAELNVPVLSAPRGTTLCR